MNLGGKQPMSFDSSSASRKSADGVPRHFPAGLRVLVVDDDHTCLKILEKMLVNCHYKVTKCSRAEDALKLLRDQRDGYDIVLSDVHMPDMDGFNLLEHVGLEMELPVIMMSADDSKDVVMKGVTHGACDYLIKPISMEALKNIWQHVVRRKKQVSKEHSGSEDGDRAQRQSEDVDYTSSANEAHWKGGGSKKRKEDETEDEERDDSSTLKKPRVVWTSELHIQFVNAVNQLGIDKAVPKKILELMNVPGLTRENVASHLQKYRIYLRKLSVPQRNGITSALDSPFGPLHGFDFHQPFATGQLSSQGAAGILNPPLNRVSSRSGMDQRTIFSSDTPTIGFLPQNDCSNKLLHGIPTNMDSKQLGAALHLPPEQPFNSMNISMLIPSHSSNQSSLPQMVQPQLRTLPHPHPHLLSEANILNTLPSGISSAAAAAVQGGFRNVHLQNLGVSVSQPLAFARNQGSDLAGSSRLCPVGNNSWRNVDPSSNATTRIEEMKSELVLSRGGFIANYDALNGRGEELEHQAAAADPTCTGDSSSRNKYAEGGMIHDIHNYFFNDQCEEADVISRILGQSESSILGAEHDCRSLDGLIFPCGKQQELN